MRVGAGSVAGPSVAVPPRPAGPTEARPALRVAGAATPYLPWLEELYAQISTRFTRAEPRQRAYAYLYGLLGATDHRNGRQLADFAGEARSDGVQRLLTSAAWEEDLVRDDVRAFVLDYRGDDRGLLWVTELSFAKRGGLSAAVQRQYSQDSRRTENCQVGLFLLHVDHARRPIAIDRTLYLPPQWEHDERRREQTGIDPSVGYRSKAALAAEMVTRTLATPGCPQWVVANQLVGESLPLREELVRQRMQFVVEVSADELLDLAPDSRLARRLHRGRCLLVAGAVAGGPAPEHRSAASPVRLRLPGASPDEDFEYSVVVRPGNGSFAVDRFFLCWSRHGARAGLRLVLDQPALDQRYSRSVREEVGLDRYKVRSWRGWYRHVTLALAAHAALEVGRAAD